MNYVSMSAFALRRLLGENFDDDLFERGRKDARMLFRSRPDIRLTKLEEVKHILSNGDFRNRPGPEYWIGCFCEFDFIW